MPSHEPSNAAWQLSGTAVIPAEAGISWRPAETIRPEVPAFAGMTRLLVGAGRLADEVAGRDSAKQGEPVSLRRRRLVPAVGGHVVGKGPHHRRIDGGAGIAAGLDPPELAAELVARGDDPLVPVGGLIALEPLVDDGGGQAVGEG